MKKGTIMAINVTWDNEEKTILRFTYEGPWDWEEFYASMAEGYAMMDAVGCKVDHIYDISNSPMLPKNAICARAGMPIPVWLCWSGPTALFRHSTG